MKATAIQLIEVPPAFGVPKRQGYLWCAHCHAVVRLCQHEVDRMETAWAGGLVLRVGCPCCGARAVRLRYPTQPAPKPTRADPKLARRFFEQMYAATGCAARN